MSKISDSKIDSSAKIDPRVRRTRQMLQQAMNELMKEKPFSDINVQDIAQRADLNRATFYKHYLDKYDLLDAMIIQRLQTMLDERLSPQPTLTHANLNILIQTVYEYLGTFHGDCQMNRGRNEQNLMMHQVQRQIYDVLLNWLRNSNVVPQTQTNSPEMSALLASWIIFGPLMQIVWGTYKPLKQEVIRQVAQSVDSALAEYLVEEKSNETKASIAYLLS